MAEDKQRINYLILAGEFKEAHTQANSLDIDDMYDLLMDLAWDSKSVTIYGFINYLISFDKDQKAPWHYSATIVLSNPLCHIEGAYQTALFHNRAALELDPHNLRYLQYLLSFHDLPDRLLKKEEAINIAQEVLSRDPESMMAREILERYNQLIEQKTLS